MGLAVITPAVEIITIDMIKQHLRMTGSSQDDYLRSLINVAIQSLSGIPRGWLGRSIGERVLEYSRDGFPPCSTVFLPFPIVTEIVSVEYTDGAGVDHVMPAGDYRIADDMYLALRSGRAWPATGRDGDSVRIRYKAGLPAGRMAEMEDMVHGVRLLVGYWYRNGEAASEVNLQEAPFTITGLLSQHRIW